MADSARDDNASSALTPLTVNIYRRQQQVCSVELKSQLELGRQRPNEPAPYSRIGDRLTIARTEESGFSRSHLHFELKPEGRVRITNLSQVNPVILGIGVHSGTARVGNIGSTRKFKYGPLGSTVHLAAQIEAATRQWSTSVLISEATASQLDETFSTRRLGPLAAEVLPTQLYELAADPSDVWPETKRRYETALEAYERGDLPTATRLLAKLLADRPTDRPALEMLARVNAAPMGRIRS